jgi:hypothetical protein
MLTSNRLARTAPRDHRHLLDGQMHSDFKEAVIVVLLWLTVCGLAGLS